QVIARAGGTAAPAQQQPQAPAQNNPPSNNDGNVGAIAVSADDDPFLGPADAKVTVIEFSDFQCPFCRRFWSQTLPEIKANYIDTGKIKFVYRDFPLDSIHPGARPAAVAAGCAEEQGKFWEYHDKIFEEENRQGQGTVQFTNDDLKRWAGEIGLNAEQFNSCLDSNKYNDEVSKDFQDGAAAGVSGTPTVFVNGRAIVGAQPFAAFQQAIEQALAA
ncbi:MAG: DsbA family protein, partial [Candidatus Aenigmarchaeota archaeon]|nr:DsbA family protein [Candidatus Aenigmarchaeota archaeon]